MQFFGAWRSLGAVAAGATAGSWWKNSSGSSGSGNSSSFHGWFDLWFLDFNSNPGFLGSFSLCLVHSFSFSVEIRSLNVLGVLGQCPTHSCELDSHSWKLNCSGGSIGSVISEGSASG
jgi:hypothetical protein